MGGVASSIAALGNGTANGDIGYIRVSQGGESQMIRLFWDNTAGKWFSANQVPPIESTDGEFMRTMAPPSTDWQYLGNPGSDLAKWTLKAIPCAGALFTAGLKLQDRLSARIWDDTAAPCWLTPWFYEYDDGDPIIFDNDTGAQAGKTWNGHADLGFEPASQNIGHGAILKSDGSAAGKLYTQSQYDDGITTSGYHPLTRGGGWDYVKFYLPTQPSGSALGGVPTSTTYTPTKKYLYPTLYAIGTSTSFGIAAISYEVRWTS